LEKRKGVPPGAVTEDARESWWPVCGTVVFMM